MNEKKFVSRGGIKLEHALGTFNLDAKGLTALDVGSSTGGFVDCLLQHGAIKVYSVDTAYGELAWKLRQDPRVVVIERQNILFLEKLPELVDLVTIDVTFTSLTKILPVIKKFMKPDAKVLALLKPQYEDQKLAIKHHGIFPNEYLAVILQKIIETTQESGFRLIGQTESQILGTGGNREFFLYMKIL